MVDGGSLRDVGEQAFLDQLCARLRARSGTDAASPNVANTKRNPAVLVGPGDDCAVVEPGAAPIAITTDAAVEGVHFVRGWLSPAEIGRRTTAATLSDLAAMGASPTFTIAAVAAPSDFDAAELAEILDSCAAASEAAGAVLVGGNLTSGDSLSLTMTALGGVRGPCLERRGAVPGDRLVVTGTLGGAAAAVAKWRSGGTPSPALRERFASPVARIQAGKVLAAAGAHAAIDVSDGLLADLGHLCAASGVGAVIERERLPRLPEVAALDAAGQDFAATGGEDYELLLACGASLESRLQALASEAGVALTVIGECTERAGGVSMIDRHGRAHPVRVTGYDHWKSTP